MYYNMKTFSYLLTLLTMQNLYLQQDQNLLVVNDYTSSYSKLQFEHQMKNCKRLDYNFGKWLVDYDYVT